MGKGQQEGPRGGIHRIAQRERVDKESLGVAIVREFRRKGSTRRV